MTDFLLYASVVALFLVCVLVVLVILMQRPSANAGMGSALGGGAAETVFGGESASVLSKMTTTLTVILFLLSFGLYLGFVAREKPVTKALDAKSTAAPAAPVAPAAPAIEEPAAAVATAVEPAGPAVRRLARELGVDLARVRGSGPAGRIIREDVIAAVRQASAAPAGRARPTGTDRDEWGPVRREQMSRMRKTKIGRAHV